MPLALLHVPISRHLDQHAHLFPTVQSDGDMRWGPVAMSMAAYHSSTRMVAHGPVLAVSGTDLGDFGHACTDIVSDAQLVLGQVRQSSRYRAALDYLHHHAEVRVIVGHSLGGTIADALARDTGRKSVAYNPGAGPLALFGDDLRDEPNHRVVRIANDPISAFDAFHARTLAAALDPHGLSDQFDHAADDLMASIAWIPGRHIVIAMPASQPITPTLIVSSIGDRVWNYRQADGSVSDSASLSLSELLVEQPTWSPVGSLGLSPAPYHDQEWYKPATYYTPATQHPTTNPPNDTWSGAIVAQDVTYAELYRLTDIHVEWAVWGPPTVDNVDNDGEPSSSPPRAVDVTRRVQQAITAKSYDVLGGEHRLTMCLRSDINVHTRPAGWHHVLLGANCWSHRRQNTENFPTKGSSITLYATDTVPPVYVSWRWKDACEAQFGSGVVLISPPFGRVGVLGHTTANLSGDFATFTLGSAQLLQAAMCPNSPFGARTVGVGEQDNYDDVVDFTSAIRTPNSYWHWNDDMGGIQPATNTWAYMFAVAGASNIGTFTTVLRLYAELL